jgi:hypothetical protein
MPEPTEPISVESAIEQSASIFEGHPAEGEVEGKPDEKVDVKPSEKPDEKVDKKPDEKPAFEYASQEAAEKGVKDTKTLMHKKSEEAKRERERAEDLQKQLNESLLKVTTKPAELAKPTSADKMKDLLDQVNLLDPEDKDYHLKVAEIWGRREDEMQGDVDAKVKEALDTYDKRVKEKQAKANDEISTQKTIVSDAEIAGKDAGLDMKKGSDDSEMFWAFADRAPEGSIEDQIKWTVDKVVGLKTAYAAPGVEKKEKALEAEEKAKATQEQNSLLERGGTKPAEKAVPETPLGLGDAFTQIQRRI